MEIVMRRLLRGLDRLLLLDRFDWDRIKRFHAYWRPLLLWGLVVLALFLRLYGLNWDQGHNFHPDERQILFHVTTLKWPTSWVQFFDPQVSGLNPKFFAYGSFPIYLLALLGMLFYHNLADSALFVPLTLLGRVVSALFDCGTILLTAWLALRLAKNDSLQDRISGWNGALLVTALLVFTPLHLQLSHFYAVDTILVFFVMLTLLACAALVHTSAPLRWTLVAGVGYGLAMATKVSAFPLLIPLLLAAILRWYRLRSFLDAFAIPVTASCVALMLFFLTQPYVLLDRTDFITQIVEQNDMARGILDYPYTRQFAGTPPYLYHIFNIVLWGMGLMLGCCALAALFWFIWRIWRRNIGAWLVVLSWALVYTAWIGGLYVKFMRYMLPIYPALILMGAVALIALVRRLALFALDRPVQVRWSLRIFSGMLLVLVLAGTMFHGLALLNVYSQPNTRVQASLWIYQHIPAGSTLTYEQWDDPLPVTIDGLQPTIYNQATYYRKDANGNSVANQGLDLYGDDTVEKARELANLLPTLDAITMATDRLDKSIPRLPARYPLTIHYYQLLFSGQLGFRLAAQFENHPHLFGITLDDSGADESYSVFDHPTCRIFIRVRPYPYTSEQLVQKLLEGVTLPSAT